MPVQIHQQSSPADEVVLHAYEGLGLWAFLVSFASCGPSSEVFARCVGHANVPTALVFCHMFLC